MRAPAAAKKGWAIVAAIVCALLCACGGGGGDGGSSCQTSISPHFASAPSLQATVGQQYVYAAHAVYACIPFFTDCGGIDGVALPAGAVINDFADAVVWTPSAAHANTSAVFAIDSKPDLCGRRARQSWAVHVFAAPAIQSFAADKTSALPGEAVTFTAVFQGSGTIDGIGAITSGSPVTASFATDTNVRLRVSNPAGVEVSQVLFIDVLGPPEVSFAARPLSIVLGNSSRLEWTVSANAAQARIDPGNIDARAVSEVLVSPGATTAYTLTASNAAGSTSRTVTVTVIPPAAIDSFSASPASTSLQGSVSLSATFQGTLGRVIGPNAHGLNTVLSTIASGGTIDSGPLFASTLFELFVDGAYGGVSRTVLVRLTGAGTFQPTTGDPLQPRRISHAATALNDGRIFISGGVPRGIDPVITPAAARTTEIFDPATQTFSAGPDLLEPRIAHKPVLLPDGRVFIVAGSLSPYSAIKAEVFDPVSATISPAGNISDPSAQNGSAPPVLLRDGRVLVPAGIRTSATTLTHGAFIWDPASSFGGYKPFAYPDQNAYMRVRAADDRVFFFHVDGTSSIFVPGADTFVAGPAQTLTQWPYSAAAVDLPNGRLLLKGGFVSDATAAAVYDPMANESVFVGVPNFPLKLSAGVALLPDGRIFFAGGQDEESRTLPWAEILDATTGQFTKTGGLNIARSGHTATSLADGRVLVVGGCVSSPCRAEIYSP